MLFWFLYNKVFNCTSFSISTNLNWKSYSWNISFLWENPGINEISEQCFIVYNYILKYFFQHCNWKRGLTKFKLDMGLLPQNKKVLKVVKYFLTKVWVYNKLFTFISGFRRDRRAEEHHTLQDPRYYTCWSLWSYCYINLKRGFS